ncbi:MAG: hypothetical protein GY928_12795 [Colwellia sp.]|nr:hypothetical protein [Colwellia sp.]
MKKNSEVILVWLFKYVLPVIILISLFGCSKDDPLRLEQRGYLNLNTEFMDFTASKVDVPECTTLTPDNVKVRLVNSEGLAFTTLTAISITGNTVTPTEQLTFPVGTYTVDEISLVTGATITHSAPNALDNRFDFALYANNPLPYQITIQPEQTTDISAQLMCYTEEDVLNAPDFDWFVGIIELQTFAFNLPAGSCVNGITLLVNKDGVEKTLNIPLYKVGLYRIPIPVDFDYINLRIFVDGQLRQSFAFNSYNDDGVLDASDVIQIPDKCN